MDYNPSEPPEDTPSWLSMMVPLEEVAPSKNSPLCGSYFNKGEVSILASNPKSGKTWICLDLAMKLSQGLPAFDKFSPEQPLNVLYMFGDNQPGFLKDRAAKLGHLSSDATYGNLKVLDQFAFRTSRNKLFDLVDNKDFDILVNDCKNAKIDLIFVDTLVAWTAVNEGKNEELRPLLLNVKRLAHDTGAHVCLLHHNRKESGHGGGLDKIIGGTVLVRLVGEIYTLRADINEDSGEIEPRGWFVSIGGWYERPPRCYYDIAKVSDTETTVTYDFDKLLVCGSQQEVVDEIHCMYGEWTKKDLMIATGCTDATARRAISKCKKHDIIEQIGFGKGTVYRTINLSEKTGEQDEPY